MKRGRENGTYDHAVLPDFDVVTNSSGFNNSPGPDVNVVPYLHGIIVEIPSIRLVWRPVARPPFRECNGSVGKSGRHQHKTPISVALSSVDVPHDAPFSDQAISSQRDNDCMAASSSPQVTSNDRAIRDNRFASENDVLWPSNNCLARYLVPSILGKSGRMSKCDVAHHTFQANESKIASCAASNTYGLNVLVAGVTDWLLHP